MHSHEEDVLNALAPLTVIKQASHSSEKIQMLHTKTMYRFQSKQRPALFKHRDPATATLQGAGRCNLNCRNVAAKLPRLERLRTSIDTTNGKDMIRMSASNKAHALQTLSETDGTTCQCPDSNKATCVA